MGRHPDPARKWRAEALERHRRALRQLPRQPSRGPSLMRRVLILAEGPDDLACLRELSAHWSLKSPKLAVGMIPPPPLGVGEAREIRLSDKETDQNPPVRMLAVGGRSKLAPQLGQELDNRA